MGMSSISREMSDITVPNGNKLIFTAKVTAIVLHFFFHPYHLRRETTNHIILLINCSSLPAGTGEDKKIFQTFPYPGAVTSRSSAPLRSPTHGRSSNCLYLPETATHDSALQRAVARCRTAQRSVEFS